MDNDAPIIIAAKIRGNLISKIIVLIVGDKLELMKNSFEANDIITSFGDTGYLPIKNEIKNNKISGIIIKAVTDIS